MRPLLYITQKDFDTSYVWIPVVLCWSSFVWIMRNKAKAELWEVMYFLAQLLFLSYLPSTRKRTSCICHFSCLTKHTQWLKTLFLFWVLLAALYSLSISYIYLKVQYVILMAGHWTGYCSLNSKQMLTRVGRLTRKQEWKWLTIPKPISNNYPVVNLHLVKMIFRWIPVRLVSKSISLTDKIILHLPFLQ